jgi:predicted neuraminidase
MKIATLLAVLGLSAPLVSAQPAVGGGLPSGVVASGFVGDPLPTPSCHASTIVESDKSLIAAWFGGSEEGARDVVIWLSRNDGNGWSKPEEVANGIYEKERIQYPCWNPVLYKLQDGPLLLYYREGPSPTRWWSLLKTSDDNGRTWSKAKRLPTGMLGPIKNKPVEVGGWLLCGSSVENDGWRVHIERSRRPLVDQSWSKTQPLNRALDFGAIQPTILAWPDGNVQVLCRTKQDVITDAWSGDRGATWSRMKPTTLPNPNSGIDGVVLDDGRALLVYNHTTSGRGTLNVSISPEGRNWLAATVLENTPGSEFSYPAVIQGSDKMVHVTYTWKRQKIKHVVIDPSQLSTKEIVDGQWPK